ncbi:hypothetical protein I4U23_015438 [Adineta vaga]|nr:hypothetical protein I4U23_015438 [Adineta vaga]
MSRRHTSDVAMDNDSEIGTYTKTFTITPDNPHINIKFFKNPSFCTTLQRYLSQIFNITCSIKVEDVNVIITLDGDKQNVKSSRDAMKDLFESVQSKIYNSEDTDKKVMYLSSHIFSDAAIDVIQQIIDHENIFTLWEKTKMFSGYYKVLYFSYHPFDITEAEITQILYKQIDYVENMKMPDEKTKSFIKEIEQAIISNRKPELAIIRHTYPNRIDIKISLLGRKKLVKIVKKKLQLIATKHTLKQFELKLHKTQYEYLIDNCLQQLADIENHYVNDNVKIRLQQKEFYAPQYLIEKIKEEINELICETVICTIKTIDNSALLSDENKAQLDRISTQYSCRIERVVSKTELQIFRIPKAVSNATSPISNTMLEQSNQFCSSLSLRAISTSNISIQIHKNDPSVVWPSDITVVSTDAGILEQHVTLLNNNEYFETNSGKKVLFKRWLPPALNDGKAITKLKQSITKFIVSVTETIDITLITSKGNSLRICENDINNYINKHVISTQRINKALELKNWNQHVVNYFYKYCLDKSVLAIMDLHNFYLDLIGLPENVVKAITKYENIPKILKLKSLIRIPPAVTPRKDRTICRRLATSLAGEGYSICKSSSNNPLSESQINQSDLLLIYFSGDYLGDAQCMNVINYARKNSSRDMGKSAWIYSMKIDGLFYNIFETEIELEFSGDFDLEYDQMLLALLRHTKPGVTGQYYPQDQITLKSNPTETNYEEGVFGSTSLALQKLTSAQRQEREQDYQLRMKNRLKNERISHDEIDVLVSSLILVTDDLEQILSEKQSSYGTPYPGDSAKLDAAAEQDYSIVVLKAFLDSAKRWLNKAPNVTKKNFPPFTPTGDINDAQVVMYSPFTDYERWQDDSLGSNYSYLKNGYFSVYASNFLSFTMEQAHEYFERLIIADGRINIFNTKIEENELVWPERYSDNNEEESIQDNKIDTGDKTKTMKPFQNFQQLLDLNLMLKLRKRILRYFSRRKRHLMVRTIEERSQVTKDDVQKIEKKIDDASQKDQKALEVFLEYSRLNVITFRRLCGIHNN